MNYIFLPEAKREFSRQTARYQKINPELGGDFVDIVFATVDKIIDYPLAWSKVDKKIRRCLTDKFPYGILYHFSEKKQLIIIVAVMHNRQEPGYWKDRL